MKSRDREAEFTLEAEETNPAGAGWGAAFHGPDGRTSHLEIQWPGDRRVAPTVLDGFAAAVLPAVLRSGGTLRVRGSLTRGALRNLTELGEAWANWRPEDFHPLSIEAERVLDDLPSGGAEAVVAWSGTLRSTHTLVRHLDGLVPGSFKVRAAVRVQGLRLGENEREATRELEGARRALAPERLEIIAVRVNTAVARLRDPEMGALPIVAAALHAVGAPSPSGLHARGWHFGAQRKYPRPGPALQDLFSGDRFSIRADGGTASPPEMVEDVSRHPALAACVSDCRAVAPAASPCGRCGGCTLLALAFRAAGRAPSHPSLRPGILRAASLPFRDAALAADAEATLSHWRGRRGWLRGVLASRSAADRVRVVLRDNLRWLASTAGLMPPWPR